MFEIDIQKEFSAAHQLRGYDGNCANLHGHNWTVQVFIRAHALDSIGIALDFKKLKQVVNEVLDTLDHHNLSELPQFKEHNPTSEYLACYICNEISQRVNDDRIRVNRVRVCESPTSGATYFPDEV